MMTNLKYLTVREHLRERIKTLDVGTLLPPEPALCEQYGVSRITLRKAIDGLVEEGKLVREQGRGTFVSQAVHTHKHSESFVHAINGFHTDMTRRGLRVGTEVLRQETIAAPTALAERLDLPIGEPIVELVRLRTVDGQPDHIVHTYLPLRLYPATADEDFSEQSLYEFLRAEYGARLARSRFLVEVGTASPDEARMLQLASDAPLLVVTSTVLDPAGHPIIHGFSRLRPDVSQVEFEVVSDDGDAP